MKREEFIFNNLKNYASASPTAKYSVENFRLINNISNKEFDILINNKKTFKFISLIKTKEKLNIKDRLLDSNISASEVAAIKVLLELDQNLENKKMSTGTSINIKFVKTNDEMNKLIFAEEEKVKNKEKENKE